MKTFRILLILGLVNACLLPSVSWAADAAKTAAPALTDSLIKKVQAGMTRQEVQTLLGEPGKIQENKDGTQVWLYQRKEKSSRPPQPGLPKPMPDKSRLELGVRITFNAEGIAERVQQRILEEERKSRLVNDQEFEEEMGS